MLKNTATDLPLCPYMTNLWEVFSKIGEEASKRRAATRGIG